MAPAERALAGDPAGMGCLRTPAGMGCLRTPAGMGCLRAPAGMGCRRAPGARANESERFDAVIRNAGTGCPEPRRVPTMDGVDHVFEGNVLTSCTLTALIIRPAVSGDPAAAVTGGHFHRRQIARPAVTRAELRAAPLDHGAELTGTALPAAA
jgi:hypothetical protein